MPETVEDVLAFLRQVSDEHDLIARAKSGFAAWWVKNPEMSEYSFTYEEVQMNFKMQRFAFRHARLSYPYIDTTLTLVVRNLQVGTYSLITDLDGSVIDDHLDLPDPWDSDDEQ